MEQQPPKIKNTIVAVWAHAGKVHWARAEYKEAIDGFGNPLLLRSRCGRALICLIGSEAVWYSGAAGEVAAGEDAAAEGAVAGDDEGF